MLAGNVEYTFFPPSGKFTFAPLLELLITVSLVKVEGATKVPRPISQLPT